MARAATAPELALFRTPGQWSKIRAAIYTPSTVYSGRINQSFSTLDKVLEFEYDGPSGTLSDVLEGMTVYIGSSAGAWDKGIARLRSIDSDTVFIGETADIRFANDDYFTIVDSFELWARPVLISSGVPYMDGGIAYSDQHTNYLPLVRMGPNRVKKKTASTVSITFDFSAIVPGSSVSSRVTTAPGSSSITGDTTATPSVVWGSVGWKKVYHTVTGANGKSFFGVRYVFIWDETNEPEPVEWERLRGDVDSGGWELSLILYDQANLSEVRDHALILLFAEDRFGSTSQEIGPVTGAENILFSGWIAGESIDWKSQGGAVSFTAHTANYFLQKIPAWPDGVEFTTSAPASWTKIKNLTVDLGLLHHFLMWRTTAPRIMDIYGIGDTKYTKEVSSLASDLWSQIVEMSFDQIFARPLVNYLNQLYIEVHPQLIPLASRSHPTVTTFLEQDLGDGIDLQRATMDKASIVDLSGVAINSSGAGTAYFSLSPGHSHSHYGNPVVVNRILVSSQSQANQLAGLYRGWLNAPFDPVSLKIESNNRLIDLCPLQKCAVAISSGDTIREISESLGLIPMSVERVFNPGTGYLSSEITFEVETFEDLSTNGDVPGSGNVSIPPLPPLPKLPPIDIIIPGTISTPTEEGGPPRVLVHDSNVGLIYTENFNESSPNWETVNAGLTQAQYLAINVIMLAPDGALYVASRIRTGFGIDPFIARAPYIGGTFEIIEDVASIQAEFPSHADFSGVNALGVDPLTGQVAYVISGGDSIGNHSAKIFVGSGLSFSAGAAPTMTVGSIGSLSYGAGNWRLTAELGTTPHFIVFSADGSSIVRDVTIGGTVNFDSSALHVPISTTDIVYIWRSSGLLRITANGANAGDFSTVIGSDLNSDILWDNKTATSPTGEDIFSTWDTGERGRSSDSGAIFTGIPFLPFGSAYSYDYAGGEGTASRWIAGRGIIRYTPDRGDTWEEKAGDINGVAPILSLTIVKVVEY
jgi:hypothetical protein